MRFVYPRRALLIFLALLGSVLSLPQPIKLRDNSKNKAHSGGVSLEWAVIGDSWASGVAYNSSNVYQPTDAENCFRTTESWGAQMAQDSSWSRDPQVLNFAACGGTLMDDLKRQMEEKAGNPQLVWGMFGGNNAYFGAIARACIYQPLDPGHPFGWGKAWDEDEDGTGVCKQNLQMAKEYLDKPSSMRKAFTNALDDILNVAQGNRALDYSFDLYVSSYVRFFDDTTDDCDEWTFAHNRLSVGRPKLVKGLRKTINEKILQLNNIQADVIQNYKPPATDPKLVNVNIKNFQPDYLFDGHRFCEKGRSLEDQYYHKDLWLWNLQYNDDKTGEEGGAVTGNDGVKQMASTSSAGVNVTEGFQTVLGADTNPDAIIPPDQDAHTQQYGFGWTARPFHPKFDGHTALKDAFIKKMQDDRVPGIVLPDVAPPPEVPELVAPTPPPPPNIDKKCWGVGTGKFLSREMLATLIETEFCPTAVKQGVLDVGAGSLSRRYNEGSMEDVTIAIEWVPGLPFQPNMKDCVDRLLGDLTDGCDGNDPNNIDNSKAGGLVKVGEVTYRIDPQTSRQSATLTRWAGCDSVYKALFNDNNVWGRGFANADFGADLKQTVADRCALFPDTWSFSYGLGPDGREWEAKFRTGIWQNKCLGHLVSDVSGTGVDCQGRG